MTQWCHSVPLDVSSVRDLAQKSPSSDVLDTPLPVAAKVYRVALRPSASTVSLVDEL